MIITKCQFKNNKQKKQKQAQSDGSRMIRRQMRKSKLAMEELWLCERAMASERTHTFAHSESESTTDAYCRGIFFWPWQI